MNPAEGVGLLFIFMLIVFVSEYLGSPAFQQIIVYGPAAFVAAPLIVVGHIMTMFEGFEYVIGLFAFVIAYFYFFKLGAIFGKNILAWIMVATLIFIISAMHPPIF